MTTQWPKPGPASPTQPRTTLEFNKLPDGVWLVERVTTRVFFNTTKRKASSFAFIRPALAASGLLDRSAGWVLTRNDFGAEPVYFDGPDALDNAKRHAEALFALEGE